MMMSILHLFQPHQADQLFDPGFRILRMQALTNLATPIRRDTTSPRLSVWPYASSLPTLAVPVHARGVSCK